MTYHDQFLESVTAPALRHRKCEKCGCVEERACNGGCAWVDAQRDLCTACVPLHVYATECDWFVAESRDDAWRLALEQWGGEISDYGDVDDMEQVDDVAVISIWTEDPGEGEKVSKTAAQWAREHGRGWLCGTEF